MIEIRSLTKGYHGRTVLDIPSLSLLPGERYALIGANGSGKSTLLRILAGQLSPDTGEIALQGLTKDDVGYLPQTPYAFDLSVLQNVMLPLGRSRAAREAAESALEQVGLTALMHARGSRLSGGETQRMALARLLVRSWKLLLLDEPTSATDIAAGDAIESALLQYADRTGCTLLFSSHAPGQALRLATQAILLDQGRVAEMGEASAVLRAPVSPEAQRFLRHWAL